MRLRHLELHGYKTFASRTGFDFDGGITAIVGPNGSGKSNIADALRWVLGEQSFRSLRGKRTEDMIFSGSAQRARLGMASASLLLDNESGWLPIDFSEVTITRRAYRSGENEYLLNGQRVRLGDIAELLSKSGLAQRTYTVVGQGVVDAVLSLRPEDRRALFEEAAGIAVYRSKRSESLSRLDETRANLLRVNDIVNEIAPRLRRLEREAERAEIAILLKRQLEELLRTWYGYRWHQAQLDLRHARGAVKRREAHLERRREAVAELDRQMAALRAQQAQAREQLGAWHRESADLHRQMEGVQRNLAVWHERARLLRKQGDDLEAELAGLSVQDRAAAEQVQRSEEDVAAADARRRERDAEVDAARQELEELEAQRGRVSREMAQAQAQAMDLAARLAEGSSRLAQLAERRESLAREREQHGAAILDLRGRAQEIETRARAAAAEEERLRRAGQALADEVQSLEAALAAGRARQGELRTGLADAQAPVERLQARYDALARLREEGEGLHAGVRAVLWAAKKAQGDRKPASGPLLAGIVGTVTELVQVPPEYETAVEVALGGHLQDVVVESWPHAEAAIAYLRSGERGRATFLPLDTVRPGPRLEVPRVDGAIAVASDLVQAREGTRDKGEGAPDRREGASALAVVVGLLLNRTLVVRDLKAARAAFEQLRGGFQVVTLAGEVLRSGGAVTGGQGKGQGRVLVQEREWRELPGRLQAARERAAEMRAALAVAAAEEEQLRQQLRRVGSRQAEHSALVAQARTQQQGLERDADRVAQQIAWRDGLVAQVDAEAAKLDPAEQRLRSEAEQVEARQAGLQERSRILQAELDQVQGAALYHRLSEARTAATLALAAWERRRAALDGLAERRADLRRQAEARRQRLADLRREEAALAQEIGGQASREAVIQGWLEALALKIDPVEAEVARLEAESEQRAAEEPNLRARLREAEAGHAEAVLGRSRQEERRQRLRRQIMDDFGLVEMEEAPDMADQLPLPLAEMVSTLPVVETMPEGLEEEIQQLRAQIKRMGTVQAGAIEEYAEVRERHTFLSTQAADLEEAAHRLHDVIAELDEVMRHEFERTFDAVAERFGQNFQRLFGGGLARLNLTEPDDLATTGVEIVARPPGKRLQTLALLSGGERALTAVALVFAFLQTNPPPFCILDEVDAMLDEANVQRFRTMLQDLAGHIQFIVITHNRTTIQAANTIYGVSMGDDSVSQVVSLRLEGERVVTPGGMAVELAGD